MIKLNNNLKLKFSGINLNHKKTTGSVVPGKIALRTLRSK
jgi:hypothetical protein